MLFRFHLCRVFRKLIKIVSCTVIPIIFINCSPGFQDKIIRGRDITESFFLQHQGKYKNGFNKHIIFYKNPSTKENLLDISFYSGVQGHVVKQNNHFIVVPYLSGSSLDNGIRFQMECKKKYEFNILRVEEIPSSIEEEKTSEYIKIAKKNPLPLKYLMYRSFISKSTDLSEIYEPVDNQLNPDDQNQVRTALANYCNTISMDNDDDFSENRYGADQYFVATTITNEGFTMLDDNSIQSNSKTHYQPQYGYNYSTRYSLYKNIVFTKEESNNKFVPLAYVNTVRSVYNNDDSLIGDRRGNLFGITTEVKFHEMEDNTLLLSLDSIDSSCRIPFSIQIPVKGVYLINSEVKRSNVVTSHLGPIQEFYAYINSDIDIISTISQLTYQTSKSNPLIREAQLCTVIDKLKNMKEQNLPIQISLIYSGESSTLTLMLLDSKFNKIQLFELLERVEK